MIAESTPRGYGTTAGQKVLDEWFTPLFQFITSHHVKIFSYINMDWDRYPLFKGDGWGDSRVQSNALVKAFWLEQMQSGTYLHSSADLFDQLGYHPTQAQSSHR